MCGIAGFLQSSGAHAEAMRGIMRNMADQLVHRGPDDSDIWVEAAAGVAFGHRRLSIVDLSPQGRQPMVSGNGRYIIVFNGEIYNFAEIRSEIEHSGLSYHWRGHSDTEVMLGAIEAWGIERALHKFNGMFAFALWDKAEQTLYLSRDRFGEKPLYYGWVNNSFLFGSELKALKAYPGWHGEIDRNALASYFRYQYVPAPHSIYKDIYKLQPGTLLTLRRAHNTSRQISLKPYWSFDSAVCEARRMPYKCNSKETVRELDRILRRTVRLQMVADVPLGAFLSGGVDSSTIVALMQAESTRPVRTFTIGFKEEAYNEANHAQAVARHLGTEHTELYVAPEDAIGVIDRLPTIYDEPFGDASQIPTVLLAQLTRQHVKVSLSGDGGDEIFGGYNRYFWASNLWRLMGWMPYKFRIALCYALAAVPPAKWDSIFSIFRNVLPKKLRYQDPGDKIHKITEIIDAQSRAEVYLNLVSLWKNPTEVVIGAHEPPTLAMDSQAGYGDFIERMMYVDTLTYMPDDILVKVDRAAMAASLESRIPYLDHEVVEFSWRLPLDKKINKGQGKWILRQVLYQYVPKKLIERPKKGFGVPIESWLRGPLRDWAESLIDPDRLRSEGFLNVEPIRRKWTEHLSGRRNWQYYMWNVLMFQAWLAENKPNQVIT